ncbi:MAG: LysE family transporter [Promethearchaeota archaeon]
MIEIFIFSFIVALTGALTPGPVLTFTVYKSINGEKGYLAGFWIILGHAVLELTLIIILLLGAYIFLQNIMVLIFIGVIGGVFLGIFGILTIRETYKKSIELDFQSISDEDMKGFKGNSFIGGILFSLSNPYWALWWAVIGLSFMINFGISLNDTVRFTLFFLGHELGDFIFYIPVSIFAYKGGKSLNPKMYKYILYICGAFMIGFGCYLAFNIIFFPPIE